MKREKSKSKSKNQRQSRRFLQRYTARIHIADAARIILSGLETNSQKNDRGGVHIYNCVDDDPEGRAGVDEFARGLLGLEPSTTKSCSSESQERVRNAEVEEMRVSNL